MSLFYLSARHPQRELRQVERKVEAIGDDGGSAGLLTVYEKEVIRAGAVERGKLVTNGAFSADEYWSESGRPDFIARLMPRVKVVSHTERIVIGT